jgi:hypothetical protein
VTVFRDRGVYLREGVREGCKMNGCITTKDVLKHPMLISRLFGARCYLRCLRAVVSGRSCTFLEMVR